MRHAHEFWRADRLLLLALLAEAYFYFMGALAVLIINNLGITEYKLSQTYTSYLSAAMMIGICAGSLTASRISAQKWRRSFVPAGLLMAATFLAVPAAQFLPPYTHFGSLLGLFLLTGAGAALLGFFLLGEPASPQILLGMLLLFASMAALSISPAAVERKINA